MSWSDDVPEPGYFTYSAVGASTGKALASLAIRASVQSAAVAHEAEFLPDPLAKWVNHHGDARVAGACELIKSC
ncbi:MAG: hypothetical protein OXR73_19185 [Myxococcales bacterium]|nr:hypothetical protein [Myxococcales bacterium]